VALVTLLYYALCVYVLFFLSVNFIRAKNLQEAALYAVVALPFALRVLRLK
jgi:hypothetical protein